MKKLLVGLLAGAGIVSAAISNFRVLGATATQALIAYTAPDGNACSIQVSLNASLTPLIPDVDPGTFANSNLDLSRPGTVVSGLARTVLVGQRAAQYATAGTYSGVRHFSRALEAYTMHYGLITCPSTGDTLPFTFTTANIPTGQAYGDPYLSDPANPGDQPWPEATGGLATESFIDPLTGVYLQRLGLRGNNYGYWNNIPFGSAFNQGQTPCDSGGPWTAPCNVTAGSGSTTVGNSQAPLILRPLLTNNNAWNSGYGSADYGQPWTLDQLGVSLTGYANSATAAFRMLDLCLSMNGGASCASSPYQVTLGQTSSTQTVNQVNTSSFGAQSWILDSKPRINVQESSPHAGSGTVSGNTLTWTAGNTYFSLYWTQGGNGHIRISTNNDACITPPAATTSQEYTITGFTDGLHLTLSGTPPSGSVYWCANNFAVMLWRDQAPTDGSTVTLTGSSMGALESTMPYYPDNGASTACFNRMIAGGYFCMFGGLYWINPTNPGASVYYGYMLAGSNDQHGNPITNPWGTIGAIPTGETSDIDQTQSQFTFYTLGGSSGSGPLVIQGVFNPATITQPSTPYGNGQEIQNAQVVSTTAYSVTYNNGLTFTNLTPQVSAAESIANQMAAFDTTFNASFISGGPNGWNCSPYGVSTGVLYLTCLSVGADSPGWVIAFSPGDGNPAHAGQPGGPRVIGALNTFNTPNGPVASTQTALTGRSLHAVAETGETGWVQIQSNPYTPVSTSNVSSIPASSPACSTFGLSIGGQCIAIQINSFTGAGVTGYEPYFSSPQYQFTNAPGLLRTTQIGDTACIAATSVGNCNWPIGAAEILTLQLKNYGGTPGLWVFSRASYGTELPIASGPVTLWWYSIQWIIPPGGQSVNGSIAVYWNPAAGCGGAPDPHGTCLLQDVNNTSGHGEWRDGGEAVATNVPEWGQPIWGWPTDYQTILGTVPGILETPFANLTPFQAAGVNYTSTNPPFAGVYGHPWGFDAGSHPNSAGALAPPNESIRAFDNTPVQGGGGDPAFTLLTGQLYSAIPPTVTDPDDMFNSGTTVGINRKLMAQGNSCGSHPLIDISGPGSNISAGSSGSYTACFARQNGECYPGSTQGEVFVNCPGVIWTGCSGSGIHGGTPLGVGNDICVGNISNAANAVRQFTLDHTDYSGAFTRTLLSATSRLRLVFGFENNRLLPDNSWLLLRTDFLNYERSDMWMAKMLPYPAPDSVGRGTFVPVTINVKPPAGLAVNNAVVQFGYQEYGAPAAMDCTTRNDPCLAAAGSVPAGNSPFSFASENPAGVACAGGCTIAIPAISQRVLFYRVLYRNASNALLASGPVTSQIVP